jgi:hypothetical protein
MALTIILSGQPIFKHHSFCPNPVVKYGIPDYADATSNPGVKATQSYRGWWEEQIDRCINGYWTGKMFIPGRYYYYLNFYPMTTVGRRVHKPEYVDMDYEFFMLVEKCKAEGYGIISVKARRKGLSFKAGGVIDHGMRFTENSYTAGIMASRENYATDFYLKYKDSEAVVPEEFRVGKIKPGPETTILGWKEQGPTGWIEKGSKNTLYVATTFAEANVFKGKKLNDCIFEEAGEDDKLESVYGATKDCFMVGSKMRGTPFIYGTGDKMEKSGSFQNMWHEAEAHRLIKFFVSRRKLYHPAYVGAVDEREKDVSDTPYINAKYPNLANRIGMQDEKRAEELFHEELKLKMQSKNRQVVIDHLQNNPTNVIEAFNAFIDNNYNTDILLAQSMQLQRDEDRYRSYVLEYVKDNNGIPVQPLQVYSRKPVTDPKSPSFDDPYKYVHISNDGHPIEGYKNLHTAGLDGYNMDITKTASSLGAMDVMRRQPVDDMNVIGNKSVCIYYNRPPRKEIFFEICLKIAIYYNLKRQVLCDAGSDSVIGYFKENGGEKYLAPRPKAYESDGSQQMHNYGIKFTGSGMQREIMEGMIQSDIEDNCGLWDFPHLCKDMMGYDSGRGNDNDSDLHDAHGMALMQKALSKVKAVASSDGKIHRGRNDAYYDAEGNIQYRERTSQKSEVDHFADEIRRLGGDVKYS